MKFCFAHKPVRNNPVLSSLLICVLLSACGGGGGGSSSDVDITTSPADGATAVERNATVTATFDTDMMASTIDGSSFSVSDSETMQNLAGAVAFDAVSNVATFTPTSDLGVLRSYSAALADTITNLDGDEIENTDWRFTTRDGAWGTAEKIESDAVPSNSPIIEFDDNGNALAVWVNNADVFANKYTAATKTWGTPEQLDIAVSNGINSMHFAMADDGTALAVWADWDNGASSSDIRAAYYDGTSWATDELVENLAANDAANPKVAFDSAGNALVVWAQDDAGIDSIWVNYYDKNGAGWTPANAVTIESSALVAYTPNIAFDDTDTAIAVWVQDNGTNDVVHAARFANSAWSSAIELSDDASDASIIANRRPAIAMDNNGNAIVVWEQPDAGVDSIWASYFNGTSWSTAESIDSNDFTCRYQHIAFSNDGNAIALWRHNGRIRFNTYTVGSGWGTDTQVESGADSTSFPDLAVDSNGNAIAVWRQNSNSVSSAWASRFVSGTGWSTPELLETDDVNSAASISAVISKNGNAFAYWQQSDGAANSIWAIPFE